MKQLYQILVLCSPHLDKRTGDTALDTLFVRGRHFQISTSVERPVVHGLAPAESSKDSLHHAQRVVEQAGQRAQEMQRAAVQDIEQFALRSLQ